MNNSDKILACDALMCTLHLGDAGSSSLALLVLMLSVNLKPTHGHDRALGLKQGFKLLSKGVRRVVGRIRVSYNQRERLSTAFGGTGLGRRIMKPSRSSRHHVS